MLTVLKKKGLQLLLVLSLLVAYETATLAVPGASAVSHAASASNSLATYDQMQTMLEKAAENFNDYRSYQKKYQNTAHPADTITINAANYSDVSGMTVKTLQNYKGVAGTSIATDSSGTIQWKVHVDKAGLYNMALQYYPIAGKDSAIQRGVLIDNKLPFKEAGTIDFPRVWGNKDGKIEQDNRGNQLRPVQVEKPKWQTVPLRDDSGSYTEPYSFYFSAGDHTISFVSVKEPAAIRSLKLFQSPKVQSYAQVKKQHQKDGVKPTQGVMVKVQGENAEYKSSPTLYPTYDRSSPSLEPYNPAKVKINVIGGHNWRYPGQWIEWNVKVPKDGLYKIAFKSKQDTVKGIDVTRWLTIDGKTPFTEAKDLPFPFATSWKMRVAGGADHPYLFHLTKGTHSLRLTVSLGDLSPVLVNVENSMLELNAIYRQILMVTGASPDPYRDYQLDKQIPNLTSELQKQHTQLEQSIKALNKMAGGRSTQIAELSTMADQLENMVKHPDNIQNKLSSYNNNVSALGNWMQTVKEQDMSIDYLIVASPDENLPNAASGFLKNLWNGAVKLAYSFVIDYNAIGNISNGKSGKSITVWSGTGRDQAQIIKQMIDQDFTPKTGIKVNLKLVNVMQQLLPATLAKSGPDVAVQIPSDTLPVDFALRNAAFDLKQFPDYSQVVTRFRKSALVPYAFQGGEYALPETQVIPMMYYRKDIFNQMGWKVPQTWQDVYKLIPELEKHHMEFGLPLPIQEYAWVPLDPNPSFAMFLLQNGGSFYNASHTKSTMDTITGQNVFKNWTEFYTDYGLPLVYKFPNRFRSGEMPIGLDYTDVSYNTLQIFAPEIKGLWGVVPVPGTIRKDGTIDRSVASKGNSAMMLKNTKNKDASWQFMKWWTSTSVQTNFGQQMEAVQGPAGRQSLSNIKAMNNLPWPRNDLDAIDRQFKWVKGIPQVPGGYFTGRNLNNAFYSVINQGTEPRETISQYTQYIDDEITLRRKQFGLSNN